MINQDASSLIKMHHGYKDNAKNETIFNNSFSNGYFSFSCDSCLSRQDRSD